MTLEDLSESSVWEDYKRTLKSMVEPIPQKEFLSAGLLGLMSKATGYGSAERFIHEYVGDTLSPFGWYFLSKSFLRAMGSKASDLKIASVILATHFYGELAQATDFLPNPYLNRGANPKDLIAYTIGIAAALGWDALKSRRKKNESN